MRAIAAPTATAITETTATPTTAPVGARTGGGVVGAHRDDQDDHFGHLEQRDEERRQDGRKVEREVHRGSSRGSSGPTRPAHRPVRWRSR